MNERMRELLHESAKCFAEASSPFVTEWLVEHDVSADECYGLSQAIASAIRIYLDMPKGQRASMVIEQVVKDSGLPDETKDLMLAQLRFRRSIRELAASSSNNPSTEIKT